MTWLFANSRLRTYVRTAWTGSTNSNRSAVPLPCYGWAHRPWTGKRPSCSSGSFRAWSARSGTCATACNDFSTSPTRDHRSEDPHPDATACTRVIGFNPPITVGAMITRRTNQEHPR